MPLNIRDETNRAMARKLAEARRQTSTLAEREALWCAPDKLVEDHQ